MPTSKIIANTNRGIKWTQEETGILIQHYGKMLPAAIHQKIPTRTPLSIKLKAFNLGLQSNLGKISRKIYSHNENYFNELNIENSYWAGFISGDGNVFIDKNHGSNLKIALSRIDKRHLEKFRECIGGNHKIHDVTNKHPWGESDESILLICSAVKVCQDLNRHFNIIPAKTFILKPPNLSEERHVANFIRGSMDADGGIYSNDDSDKQWSVQFLGTRDLLEWIKFYIQKYVPEAKNPNVVNHKTIFKLAFGGTKQSEAILNWIYLDSVELTRLDRKFAKYLSLIRKEV